MSPFEIFILLSALCICGTIAGIMAGLLGIGGGVIFVPILFFIFEAFGATKDTIVHVTIGTTHAIIIFSGLISGWNHYKNNNIKLATLKAWMPMVLIGACSGAVVATNLNGGILAIIFGTMTILMGISLNRTRSAGNIVHRDTQSVLLYGIALLIGFISSIMGIGGATFSVPTMRYCGIAIKKAIGTAAALGPLIAIPSCIIFILNGIGVEGRPIGSFGYVNLLTVACLIPISFFSVPLGVRLVQKFNERLITIFFSGFLIIAGIRMLLFEFFS